MERRPVRDAARAAVRSPWLPWGVAVLAAPAAAQVEAAAGRPDLRPPVARYCEPDDNPPEGRPVVEVAQDGRVFCDGRLRCAPRDEPHPIEGAYGPQLGQLLADLKRRPGLTIGQQRIGGHVVAVVDDPILIRADRHTEWRHVGELMLACSQPQAAFWKVEFGVAAGATPARIPAWLPRDRGVRDAAPVEYVTIAVRGEDWGTEVPRAVEGAAGAPFELEGHRVSWRIGPKQLDSLAALGEAVARITADRSRWRTDPASGEAAPPPFLVEPGPGVTFGDVIAVVDVIHESAAAGAPVIHYGAGRARGRRGGR